MKTKQFVLAALSLGLFISCAPGVNPSLSPNNQNRLQAQNNLSSQNALRPAQRKVANRVEQLVDVKRMEGYLAALTGKVAFIPNTVIPERGTVKGRALTRQFISGTLENLGYKVELHEYRKNGINVFTRLMADEPTDEYVLVGAHMDSVSNAGGDDNGSGSTAVLEIASIMPQLQGRKVNIIFAWFDEEELGLVGSTYLAKEFKKQGMKISSVHSIDMLGWDGDGDGAIELARPDGILWDYYKMVNQTHGLKLPLTRTNTGQSDHVAFHNQGFHSLCLSEEYTANDTTPHYHRRTDTFETINLPFLANGTRLVSAVVSDLAQKVPAPVNIQIVPHDRFPARERFFHQSYEEAAAHLDAPAGQH